MVYLDKVELIHTFSTCWCQMTSHEVQGLEVVGVPELLPWLLVNLKLVLYQHLRNMQGLACHFPSVLGAYMCCSLDIPVGGSSLLGDDFQLVTAVIFQGLSLFPGACLRESSIGSPSSKGAEDPGKS